MVEDTKPIWILAHRCNSPETLATAAAAAVSGFEIDVVSPDAERFAVLHPSAGQWCGSGARALARAPRVEEHLEAIAPYAAKGASLLYIDYKGPDMSPMACRRLELLIARSSVARTRMRVIVSIAREADKGFFAGLTCGAPVVPQIDHGAEPERAFAYFRQLQQVRASYADGSTCSRWAFMRLERHFRRADALRRTLGCFGLLVAWTIDASWQARRLLELGVDVLVTNKAPEMVALVSSMRPTFRLGCNDDLTSRLDDQPR